MQRPNIADLKAGLPLLGYLQGRGVALHRAGRVWQGACPIHRERNGESFTVYPEENRWHCFGKCGRGGDLIDFRELVDGLTKSEIVADLRGGDRNEPRHSSIATSKRTPAPIYRLTDADCARMRAACDRLHANPALIERLCAARPEWTPAAVLEACAGDLGIEDGCLLFSYRHGIKRRGKDNPQTGKRDISWICGAAHGECWRQSLLTHTERHVIIAEGETDAITLLSLGLEEPGHTLIVALASATIYPKPEPFTSKHVTLCLDADKAGENATKELTASLAPYVASIRTVNLSALFTAQAL